MDTEASAQTDSPDPDLLAQRRGTLSSIYTSTTSSSPEFTADTAITPQSDDEGPVKTEESGERALADIDEVKPSVDLPIPRKRGRPRKHPIVDQKKSAHARSKTGCGTCSR